MATKSKNLAQRGFTLIELMIVVVIIGILASLAIYGVQRYVANSKSAEARLILGAMRNDAVKAFEGERMAGGLLPIGSSVGVSNRLCPGVTQTIPDAIAKVSASKYQPIPSEWKQNGWNCLKTSVTTPIYYMYNYATTPATPVTAADEQFVVSAAGDLDGDLVSSLFSITGVLTDDGSGGLQLIVSPTVLESQPEE